jgi:hypothetical protein
MGGGGGLCASVPPTDAESCTLPPTLVVSNGGVTATDVTGAGSTCSVAVPDLPSLVAVMVVLPVPVVVASPELSIVATE